MNGYDVSSGAFVFSYDQTFEIIGSSLTTPFLLINIIIILKNYAKKKK